MTFTTALTCGKNKWNTVHVWRGVYQRGEIFCSIILTRRQCSTDSLFIYIAPSCIISKKKRFGFQNDVKKHLIIFDITYHGNMHRSVNSDHVLCMGRILPCIIYFWNDCSVPSLTDFIRILTIFWEIGFLNYVDLENHSLNVLVGLVWCDTNSLDVYSLCKRSENGCMFLPHDINGTWTSENLLGYPNTF